MTEQHSPQRARWGRRILVLVAVVFAAAAGAGIAVLLMDNSEDPAVVAPTPTLSSAPGTLEPDLDAVRECRRVESALQRLIDDAEKAYSTDDELADAGEEKVLGLLSDMDTDRFVVETELASMSVPTELQPIRSLQREWVQRIQQAVELFIQSYQADDRSLYEQAAREIDRGNALNGLVHDRLDAFDADECG